MPELPEAGVKVTRGKDCSPSIRPKLKPLAQAPCQEGWQVGCLPRSDSPYTKMIPRASALVARLHRVYMEKPIHRYTRPFRQEGLMPDGRELRQGLALFLAINVQSAVMTIQERLQIIFC